MRLSVMRIVVPLPGSESTTAMRPWWYSSTMPQEVTLAEVFFSKVKIICDKCFKHPAWEIELKDADFPAIQINGAVADPITV